MMIDTCHYILFKPKENIIPRVNPNVNYELWVTMMCQCRFMSCNKCITLAWDIVNGEGSTYLGAGNIWEIFVSSQFCCEPKVALKKSF